MSKVDKELLQVAGLKVPEIAPLINRTRAAIYTGLSNSRNYFKTGHVALFVRTVIHRDDLQDRMEGLTRFVEEYYSDAADLILPSHITCSQLEHAARGAERVICYFNGNTEHLSPTSLFSKALQRLLGVRQGNVIVLARKAWVTDYLEKNSRPAPHRCIASEQLDYTLCFFMVVKGESVRPFFVAQFALAEGEPRLGSVLFERVRPLLI